MEKIKKSRNYASLGQQEILNPASAKLHGVFDGYDDAWDVDFFQRTLKIKIIKKNDTDMEFDLIGVDSSIVNAFRRILLAEIPSMAIEKVHMFNNTSIIPDEILAHRLGLIPLKANPLAFNYVQKDDTIGTDQDTLEYELKVKCTWNSNPDSKKKTDPDDMYLNHKVYSDQIKWIPCGMQSQKFKEADVNSVHPDILIAKLRPGHELDMKLRAVKGIGKDHAKFSPVATAFYRLLPHIVLKNEVYDEMAERLQKCFSPGVIKIVEDKKGRKVARVHNARYDTCSRNVLLYDDLAECVEMDRVKDHFIFSIESTGALSPERLFLESIKTLRRKCRKFIDQIECGLDD